jgi:hypothetical protein
MISRTRAWIALSNNWNKKSTPPPMASRMITEFAQLVIDTKEGVVADLPSYSGFADPVQQEIIDYLGFDDMVCHFVSFLWIETILLTEG